MTTPFPLGARVRFTEDRLSVLTPRDRKSLAGRIGVVQTDGALVKKPTVYFPAEGARPELRLFRMDPGHLELVDMPAEAEAEAEAAAAADSPPPTEAGADTNPPAPESGGSLSQSELDKLFD